MPVYSFDNGKEIVCKNFEQNEGLWFSYQSKVRLNYTRIIKNYKLEQNSESRVTSDL